MKDIDILKSILPQGELLNEEIFEDLLLGNRHLIIDWNEDGSIKDWGIL